jgi:hypothetical protein
MPPLSYPLLTARALFAIYIRVGSTANNYELGG